MRKQWTQNMVVCCRCKTGHCLQCVCVKAGKSCHDCDPSRLGHCSTQQITVYILTSHSNDLKLTSQSCGSNSVSLVD